MLRAMVVGTIIVLQFVLVLGSEQSIYFKFGVLEVVSENLKEIIEPQPDESVN